MGESTGFLRPDTAKITHLREYWRILWGGRWIVLAVLALTLALTALHAFLSTPVFRAAATVEVQPQARRLANLEDVSGIGAAGYGWFAEEKYQNTQVQVIRSRAVAEAAFRRLHLQDDPKFAEIADPVGLFQRSIRVQPQRESGLIEISAEGADREEIARWVNAVAEEYVQYNLSRARANAESTIAALENQLTAFKRGFEEEEVLRMDTLDGSGGSIESQRAVVKQKLETLNDELAKAQVEVSRLDALLRKIDELRGSGADPTSLPELAEDSTLQELNRERVAVERELETAKVSFREGHREYREKVSQLEKIRQKISDQVELIVGKIRNQRILAGSQVSFLSSQISRARDEDMAVERTSSQYSLAKASADTQKQVTELINRALNEITLGSALLANANNVSILDQARPPDRPIRPNKRINLILGTLVGLFLGVGTVFFLDYLDHTIHDPDEIDRLVGLSTLAVVPLTQDPGTADRGVREAFQTLRTGLIFTSQNRERRVVLLTSTVPQEGKSSTAALAAATIAGAGESVIVVDADLRKPTQHLHHDLSREPGLTNCLAEPPGGADWRHFVRRSAKTNSDVLTAGVIPPNPTDLLGSERFRELIADLRNSYDWVLIDSPPSLSLADSAVLATRADVVVLVVRHRRTDRDLVVRNVRQLRKIGATVAGAVLNGVDLRRGGQAAEAYASYYYYGEERKPGSAADGKAARVGA